MAMACFQVTLDVGSSPLRGLRGESDKDSGVPQSPKISFKCCEKAMFGAITTDDYDMLEKLMSFCFRSATPLDEP